MSTVGSSTWRQIRLFAVIGLVSTAAHVVCYAALRGALSASVANAAALLVTTIGNTAANRRLTFQVRGRDGAARHYAAGLAAFAIALVITSGSIGLLQTLIPRPGRPLEVLVLVGANVLATIVRFAWLRRWIEGGRGPLATSGRASARPTE